MSKSGKFYVRPSHLLCYDICPRQYYYKYIKGLTTLTMSVNLPFGTAVHAATTGYAVAKIKGESFDPVEVFSSMFENSLATMALEFSSTATPDGLLATGKVLSEKFAQMWDNSGYSPLVDDNGPVVERRFDLEVAPGIILTGQPDLVCMNDNTASVAVLDVKTTKAEYSDLFVLASEQLTDYQLLLEGFSKELSLDSEGINELGFIELFKRNVSTRKNAIGPTVSAPKVCQSRTEEQKAARRTKIVNVCNDIKKGRFEQRPLMSFNSPCSMCDFADYCWKGDDSNLIVKSSS